MSEIKDWVIAIVGFILIMSLISHLVSGRKFLKYIRFFMGLILILIVLRPTGKVFSIEKIYNDILRVCIGKMELNNVKTELVTGVGEYTDSVLSSYKAAISETIKGIVEEKGYKVNDIEAEIVTDENSEDYGIITGLKVFLSAEQKDNKIKVDKIQIGDEAVNAVSQAGNYIFDELKKHIAGQFNLNSEDIDVFVTGE